MPSSYPPEFRRKVLDLIAAGDCTKPGGTQFRRNDVAPCPWHDANHDGSRPNRTGAQRVIV